MYVTCEGPSVLCEALGVQKPIAALKFYPERIVALGAGWAVALKADRAQWHFVMLLILKAMAVIVLFTYTAQESVLMRTVGDNCGSIHTMLISGRLLLKGASCSGLNLNSYRHADSICLNSCRLHVLHSDAATFCRS